LVGLFLRQRARDLPRMLPDYRDANLKVSGVSHRGALSLAQAHVYPLLGIRRFGWIAALVRESQHVI